jgi:hypothetical protein
MSRSAHPAGPRHGDVLPEGHFTAPPADLNALDPKVWSQTVTRAADGTVSVGGIDVQSLAEEFGTPGPAAAPGATPSAPGPTSTTRARRSSPAPSSAGCTRRA